MTVHLSSQPEEGTVLIWSGENEGQLRLSEDDACVLAAMLAQFPSGAGTGTRFDGRRGYWLAYHGDWSAFAAFDTELAALRHAVANSMSAKFVPWGEDPRVTPSAT